MRKVPAWAVAVLLVCLTIGGLGVGGRATAADVQTPAPTTGTIAPTATSTTPTTAAATGPRIRIASQSTYVPANGVFRARVVIEDAPAGSYVSTTLHRRIRSRAQFSDSVAAGASVDLPDRIATFDTEPNGDLGIAVADIPGTDATRTLDSIIPIRVPNGPQRPTPNPRPVGREDEQTLDERGVYPVQYRLLAANGEELTRVVTHIVRLPIRAEQPSSVARLRVATVLPMTAPPVLQPNGRRVVDDTAAAGLSTVTSELTRQPGTAVTLSIDPQAVATLAAPGVVDHGDDLDRLKTLAEADGHQILTTTYAGVDATAFTDADLGDELLAQRVKAIQTVTAQLAPTDSGTWAALPDLSPATVTELRRLGVNQLVVPGSILSPLDDRWANGLYEPFKVTSDTGVPTPAVQADQNLQAAFIRNSADPVLGAHQLLADVALVAEETDASPASPAGVVVMPPPGWVPNRSFLRIVLDGLGADAPLTTSVTVDRLFATIPPAAANGPTAADRGGDLTRTLSPQPAASLGSYPTQLTAQRSRLASLGTMVGVAAAPTARTRDLIDVSGSRALSAAGRSSYLGAASAQLDAQFGQVSAPATEQVTLTARNARIPMSVRSELTGPAKVIVQLEGSNRLSFPNGGEVQATLTRGRNRIVVRVRAPTSGDSPLRMRVLSPDRRVQLAETRYTVRSTAVSGVGLVLTIGAFAFLVIWWARHWRSRRRRGRHASVGRHPTAAPTTEPEHDPNAPTDPTGVAAVGTDHDA